MPTTRYTLLLTLLAVLAATAPALAQDIGQCRKIIDDAARLACFDKAAASPASPAPPQASSAPASPAARFGLAAPSPTTPEAFGQSSLPVTAAAPARPAEAPAPITEITAKVVQIIDPDGKPKFVLDNGQVWAALSYIRIVPHSRGDNLVTIDSSLVGYLLRLNDSAAAFNVRRLR